MSGYLRVNRRQRLLLGMGFAICFGHLWNNRRQHRRAYGAATRRFRSLRSRTAAAAALALLFSLLYLVFSDHKAAAAAARERSEARATGRCGL